MAIACNKLQGAFAKATPSFCNLLAERMIANGFDKRRIDDAIGWVLDNIRWQTPTIADIISYDRRCKLYTYREVLAMIDRGEATFDDFERRVIKGQTYRVKKADLAQFGL